MARDVLQTVALSDDLDGISASASPGAGAIVIGGALASGGVATMTMAQIVTLTSGGNDSGITFTVTGTDANGWTISQTVTGANAGAAVTTLYFKTVTRIVQSGAVAGTLIVGVAQSNGAVTNLIPANYRAINYACALGLDVTGTITCTVQHTFDDIRDRTKGASLTWLPNSGMTSKTADTDGNYAFPPMGIRLLVVPTGSATAKLTIIQS
jgi:hypothetical protein